MTIDVLIPTYDENPSEFAPAVRLATPAGATVGIISNGKHGTIPFFDALADQLRSRHQVGEVVLVTKANYSAPAGTELMRQAKHWHALIAGIGD